MENFGFMSENGIIDAVFILRRLQEDYLLMEKSCICFLWTLGKHMTKFHEKC